jgi:Flp pilus assembly protein CpaB
MTLVGAVVVAALAGLMLLKYVSGVEQRSNRAEQMVEVAVAAGPIPKGTTTDTAIQAGQITMAQRRQQDLPPNAVRRMADIQGQEAVLDLSGGEALTTAMFRANSAAASSNTSDITPGFVAVSVQLDEAASLGGLIEVGDHVNVLTKLSCTGADGSVSDCALRTAGPNGATVRGNPSAAVFQDVKVIAVGDRIGEQVAAKQASDAEPTETTVPAGNERMFTFELSPSDAALLVSINPANLYLTLNAPGYTPMPMPTPSELPALPGEAGVSSNSDAPKGTGGQ